MMFMMSIHAVMAQKVIQERQSLSTSKADRGKGFVNARVDLDYLVRRSGNEVYFYLSYSQISTTPEAGFYYKGQKYGSEVPGLVELLRSVKGSYPKVRFDVYYGSFKETSFVYSISAKNDLGAFSGDSYHFQTTKAKLDDPQWRLVAVELEDFFPSPLTFFDMEAKINTYQRDQKEKTDYNDLVKRADEQYAVKDYSTALTTYLSASKNPQADDYPKNQLLKVNAELAKGKLESQFADLMTSGKSAEAQNNYVQAISHYTAAAKMGINSSEAQSNATRVQEVVAGLKRKQEEELKQRQEVEKKKEEEVLAAQIKNKAEAELLLKNKSEAMARENLVKENQLKAQLEATERANLEVVQKQKALEEAAESKRLAQEAEVKAKAEKETQRITDQRTLDRYEKNMSYDPVLYQENKDAAEQFHDEALAIDPYAALDLKSEWWDSNIYMEDFREDLREPKRKKAWEEYDALLHEQQSKYRAAKNHYLLAIKYTDRNSPQHKYLLKRVASINEMISFQKEMIKGSLREEQNRQANYEKAKVYKMLNRMDDNRARASQTYAILRQDYLYPNLNSRVSGSANALQRQMDFENRLNQADQQLKQDNLVTGTTTQVATDAIFDDSKVAEKVENHSLVVNFSTYTGFASFPIVSDTDPIEGKKNESTIEAVMVLPFQAGADVWFNRSKYWDIGLSGDFLFGVLPMLGNSNVVFNYGLNFKFNAGVNAIKLALEADIHGRSATYNYDTDVGLSEYATDYTQPTERVQSGKYNYSVVKLGAGLHINLSNGNGDGYLRLMTYAEKPSFMQNYNTKKPIISASGLVMFGGGISFLVDYSENYPAGGTAKYMLSNYTSRNLFKILIGKTWTIGKVNN